MALAPLVTVEELETWLREPFAGSDLGYAMLLLDAVSALVRSEAGRTWETGPVPEEARAVTFAVAARVYRNPEAATSASRQVGPFGETLSWSNPGAVGMFLSPEEKAALPRRESVRGLWTQRTIRDDPVASTGYVPVVGTDSLFPWYEQ